MLRVLKYVAAVLLLLAVLAIVAAQVGCALLARRAKTDLEAALTELKARGDELTPDMFIPNMPAENDAAPFLDKALALLDDCDCDPSLLKEPEESLKAHPSDRTDWLVTEVSKAHAFYATLAMALKYPQCSFDIDWSRGFEVEFPRALRMGRAAQALHHLILFRVAKRDVERASRGIQDCIRLGDYLEGQPSLIHCMVRDACYACAWDGTQTFLAHLNPSKERLKELIERFQSINVYDQVVLAVRAERDFGGRISLKNSRSGEYASDEAKRRNPFSSGQQSPWLLDMWEAHLIRTMNRFIDIAQLPWPECPAKARALEQELKEDKENSIGKFMHLMTHLLVPGFSGALENTKETEVACQLAALGLALELHRLQFGYYPETLEALPAESDLIDSVPPDPFIGKPLIYMVSENGFIIYSVGRDGKDDGGDALTDVAFKVVKRSPPSVPSQQPQTE